MLIRARHFATQEPIQIAIDGGRIESIGPPTSAPADATAEWVAPSFFDIQVNGCHGISFNAETLTAAEIGRVADVCRAHGTGGFCPTLITGPAAALAHAAVREYALADHDLHAQHPASVAADLLELANQSERVE